MAKGTVHPREDRWFADPDTGARIRQVTSHPSVHHHPFFFVNAWDDAMHRLLFVSHRTGRPQLYAECADDDGRLVQLTDRDDLAEWSISPSHDSRWVYFTAGTGAWRLDLDTLAEERLADFGAVAMREKGMVGAAMGTTALSWDDRWWAVPVKAGAVSRFHVIDTATGAAEVIVERDTIGHPQFHPDDPSLLFYAGPLTDRVWVVTRDGRRNWSPYRRADPLQWITHETWLPGTRDLAFVDWPHGMKAVDVDTGAVRALTGFPAWHAVADRTGRRIVCDTTFPDRGVFVFEVAPRDACGEAVRTGAESGRERRATPDPTGRDVTGQLLHLCCPHSSNAGAHWGGPFPYNDGPVEVYAPQHTHPHPRFSPDGRRVLYTSDASGHAQLYEVLVP